MHAVGGAGRIAAVLGLAPAVVVGWGCLFGGRDCESVMSGFEEPAPERARVLIREWCSEPWQVRSNDRYRIPVRRRSVIVQGLSEGDINVGSMLTGHRCRRWRVG